MGLTAARRLTAGLRRFAYRGNWRAFAVLGWGGEELWREFVASHPVRLAAAPRGADIMVLSGEIPAEWYALLCALFETVTLPRALLWLRPAWGCAAPPLSLAATLRAADIAAFDSTRLLRPLLDPNHAANQPLLPDEPPAPWRGRGDYGQGGEGMMGGKPYGRPMAMTANDRDDLALDDVPVALGPFFPYWPTGLRLDLRVQGDRIRVSEGWRNYFPPLRIDAAAEMKLAPASALGIRAYRQKPVRIVDIERARLDSHLRWMADFLELTGLQQVAGRVRRARREPRRESAAALIRSAERSGLRYACAGVGCIDASAIHAYGLRGPVARAGGVSADARVQAPAYKKLNFAPQLQSEGDAWARWRVRSRECLQSFDLMAAAGEATTQIPEGPRGSLGPGANPTVALCRALHALIGGLEFSQAVLFSASLDLDMREAAVRIPARRAP